MVVEEVEEHVQVRIQWYDSDDSTPLQFAYRAHFFNVAQDVWTKWNPGWLAQADPADEYGWERHARALVGGDEVQIDGGCASHEQLDYPVRERITDEASRIQNCSGVEWVTGVVRVRPVLGVRFGVLLLEV